MSATGTAVVVLEAMRSAAAEVVVRALATTTLDLHDAAEGDGDTVARGGVLLVGGVEKATALEALSARAHGAGRALVLFDPAPAVVSGMATGTVDGIVLSSGAHAAAVAPLPEGLPWLRLAMPLDEGPLLAAAHSRAQHRAALTSHLRLPGAQPWLLGPGPNASTTTWTLLARCLSRVVDLPWVVVVTPGAGAVTQAATVALRALPPARVRIWSAPAQTDVTALLVSCDLCVWPGADAADAGQLLAAQAAGMPAVTCRGAASDECVRDGLTGRAAATGNAEALANNLRFLLRHENFRRTMARQASEIILGEHGLVPAGRVLSTFLSRSWSR